MKNLIKRVGRFIDAEPWRTREERYLNGATSIVDLEMRMREIDNGKFRRDF